MEIKEVKSRCVLLAQVVHRDMLEQALPDDVHIRSNGRVRIMFEIYISLLALFVCLLHETCVFDTVRSPDNSLKNLKLQFLVVCICL